MDSRQGRPRRGVGGGLQAGEVEPPLLRVLVALLVASCSSGSEGAPSTSAMTTGGLDLSGAQVGATGGTVDRAAGTDGAAASGAASEGAATGTAGAGISGATGAQGTPATGGDAGGAGTQDQPWSPPTRAGDGFYRMEQLDRGLVAVPTTGGVYVGFRVPGTEYEGVTGGELRYRLLRDGAPIAELAERSDYLDRDGTADSSYSVEVIHRDGGLQASAEVAPWTQDYLRVPLSPPSPNHYASDASTGDLDGDGDYDLVLKWEPNNSKDNSQSGFTDTVYLDGLTLEGERLFRLELGPNVRAGAHYTQFVVYDLDGDGASEVALKTAPGTRDGSGAFLKLGPAAGADHGKDYRNGDGYVLSGPEYLTVFRGRDGAELSTIEFGPARGQVSSWGDNYGNRVDRFLATPAYLTDDGMPALVMTRGYYARTALAAYRFQEGSLQPLWTFDSNETPRDREGRPFTGQGAHSISVADVDGDLMQEIVFGAMSVDHDGTGLCSTGFGHGDALHVGDLLPDRPGVEVFMPHEESRAPAYSVRDGATCEVLHAGPVTEDDIGRGVAADVLLDKPGAELWAAGGYDVRSASDGASYGIKPPSINFLIYWDGADDRELQNGTSITKIDGRVLLNCEACASNNGTKSTPTLVADLLGDYREELVLREADNSALRIYTTTQPAERLLYTLMHDPQYRAAVAFQNVAYNQPPHPSFSLAEGNVPAPNLRVE